MTRNHRIVRIAESWAALLIMLVILVALVGGPPTASAATRSCYRVSLDHPPHWISGAISVEDGSRLLLVDPYTNDLITYDLQGRSTRLPSPRLSGTTEFLPARVVKSGEGFLLDLVDGRLVSLDGQLRTLRESTPVWKSIEGEHVGSLYQWTVAGDKLVGFGTLTKPDLSFIRGVLRAPAQSSGNVEILEKFASESFYLLSGYSFLASLGDEAYFVLMDKQPAIYRIVPGSQVPQRLKAFPDEYRSRPDFHTRMTGPKSAPAHYAELETFTMPAGLYAQDGMLYLLTRKPDGKAKTAWWLYQIDPQKDVILGRVQLPTAAHHLTVVPGETSWSFFERGPVEPFQQQKISSMVVIPSSAIRSLAVSVSCSSAGK